MQLTMGKAPACPACALPQHPGVIGGACICVHKVFCDAGNPALCRLIDAYRSHGHLKAYLDPLGLAHNQKWRSLDPQLYGLSNDAQDFSGLHDVLHAFPSPGGSLSDVVGYLEHMYCGKMSLEVVHVTVSGLPGWGTWGEVGGVELLMSKP